MFRDFQSFLPDASGPQKRWSRRRLIDISHESLMRVWRRLNAWADEEAQSALRYRRLAETAALHATGAASLWRDPELQLALNWRDENASRTRPGPRATNPASRQQGGLSDGESCGATGRADGTTAASRARASPPSRRKPTPTRDMPGTHALGGGGKRRARPRRHDHGLRGGLGLPTEGERGTKGLAIANESRALTALSQGAKASRAVMAIKPRNWRWPPGRAPLRRRAAFCSPKRSKRWRRLWRGCSRSRRLCDMTARFSGMRPFSPDGARVVMTACPRTGRPACGTRESGTPIGKPLPRMKGSVVGAVFSPDGMRVATASADKTARVWDVATGAPIGKPLEHDGKVNGAAFSPDGKWVVTASDDHTARIWDTATGAPIGQPLLHAGAVWSASFSPDGKWVVTASSDHTARLWDAATGAPLGKALAHNGRVYSAMFSPDGARVVTASGDNAARIWDAVTGAPIGAPMHHDDSVYDAEFSPDGKRIVTASNDDTARVWDAATGKPLGNPMHKSCTGEAGQQRCVQSGRRPGGDSFS